MIQTIKITAAADFSGFPATFLKANGILKSAVIQKAEKARHSTVDTNQADHEIPDRSFEKECRFFLCLRIPLTTLVLQRTQKQHKKENQIKKEETSVAQIHPAAGGVPRQKHFSHHLIKHDLNKENKQKNCF